MQGLHADTRDSLSPLSTALMERVLVLLQSLSDPPLSCISKVTTHGTPDLPIPAPFPSEPTPYGRQSQAPFAPPQVPCSSSSPAQAHHQQYIPNYAKPLANTSAYSSTTARAMTKALFPHCPLCRMEKFLPWIRHATSPDYSKRLN